MPTKDPLPDLPARFREHSSADGLLTSGAHLLVGVSGRCDSTALFLLLAALARTYDLRLRLLHLVHKDIPGGAEDAAFVRALAARYNLPAELRFDARPAPTSEDRSAIREEHLRCAQAGHPGAVVVTGETLDDLAEVYLARLLRGRAGAELPLLPRASGRAYPLLPFTHAECASFLDHRGTPVRSDPEALAALTARDRLRLILLPLLRRHVESEAPRRIAEAATAQEADALFLTELARAAATDAGWTHHGEVVSLRADDWRVLPAALRRRVLARTGEVLGAPLATGDLLRADLVLLDLADETATTVGPLTIEAAAGTLRLRRAP